MLILLGSGRRPGALAEQDRVRLLDGIFEVLNDPHNLFSLHLRRPDGLAAQGFIRLLDGFFVVLNDRRYLRLGTGVAC